MNQVIFLYFIFYFYILFYLYRSKIILIIYISDGLTEEERKKALSKQRKAEAKAKEGVKKETKVETQKGKKEKPVDLDPDGEKYLEVFEKYNKIKI